MATAKKPVKRTPARSSVSRSKSSSFKNSKFSKNQLIAFVLIFAVIGGFFIYRSFAAAPVVASMQGETMNLAMGPAGGSSQPIVSDSSASGGAALTVTTNNSALGTVALPSLARTMTLIARGSSCSGGWPWVAISIDGSTSVPNFKVAYSSWHAFTFPVTMGPGTHVVNLTVTSNGVINKTCSRHLDIDALTFYGVDTGTTTPPSGGTVGVPYTCSGRVNNLRVVGTGHASSSTAAALVNLASGCTGSLSINITADQNGYSDGIKVQAGAHDLTVTNSSVTCTPAPIDPTYNVPLNPSYQDGVQVQGGTNVTFRNLTVNCPNHGQAAFYIDGKDFRGISNVICDGCNLRHYYIPFSYTTGAVPAVVNSGVRNSTLHMSPLYANRCFTSGSGGTAGMVNSNNTCIP